MRRCRCAANLNLSASLLMTTRIVVFSDTHCHTWGDVHPHIRAAVADADIAVHCGDLVRMDVVRGLQCAAKCAVVVHGNSDPPDVRRAIPYVRTIEVEGARIGITHPAWGGPEFPPEDLLPDFAEPPDAILFGHTHEPMNEVRNGILYLNPGQGYSSFMVACTIAVLTVDNGRLSAEIKTIVPAR